MRSNIEKLRSNASLGALCDAAERDRLRALKTYEGLLALHAEHRNGPKENRLREQADDARYILRAANALCRHLNRHAN